MTAMAVDDLLDATPHFVDACPPSFTKWDASRTVMASSEVVVDGVLVAVDRIQGGDLHPAAEPIAAFGEPVGVGLS